jgi:catechol-2,3-dioxygenase
VARDTLRASMRLHHLAIQVHDLPVVTDFYARVLGLVVLGRPREGAVWLALGEGAVLMLEQCAEAPAKVPFRDARAGFHLLAIAIAPEERDAWEERLAAHGVEVVARTDYTLYVRDPEGNRIGLSTLDVTRFALA